MRKTFIIAMTVMVAACGRQEPESGFPRDYRSVKEADQAVPKEILADYQRLRSCRGDLATARNQEIPPYSVDRVADLVDEIRKDPAAPDRCAEELGRIAEHR